MLRGGKYLEVGVRHDGRGLAKVAHLLEARHDLGPSNAAELVDELDGGAEAVVSDAVAHEHVELVLVVFDGEHHGHRLADLDDAGHFGSPRTFADL